MNEHEQLELFHCKKFNCKLLPRACINRQRVAGKRRRGLGNMVVGKGVRFDNHTNMTIMDCEPCGDCEQGRQIAGQ